VAEQKKKFTLESFLRQYFKGILDSIGGWLNKKGVTPNFITISGLVGNIIAAILIASGKLTWGGIVAMIMGPFDALDGTMARLRNESSTYGAFIDSVTDRYDELVLLAGLLIYYLQQNSFEGSLLVYFAAMGSVLVSYIRARAEALGYNAKVGILTRVERYLILIPGIIVGKPAISLGIVAVLGNFTAIQRFFYVRKQARADAQTQKE
jgi:CDP-diacylglycerol--glycerol-3-phosphate 3-phosphatidyltransferase